MLAPLSPSWIIRAFWCFIIFLCVGRALSPPLPQKPCFLVLFVLFRAFLWLVCVCVDDKARKSTKKNDHSCFLVLSGALSFSSMFPSPSPPSQYPCFLVLFVLFGAFCGWYEFAWMTKHEKAPKSTSFRAFWCFLVLYQFPMCWSPSPPPLPISVLFGAFRAFWCFFVVGMSLRG